MRAFVTGAAGFIGSHLVRALVAKGWSVAALDLRAPAEAGEGVEALTADLLDRDTLARGAAAADVVFHLAAAVGSAVRDKSEFRRVNVLGAEAVLDAARAAGVRRFVHVSSAGVYGAVRKGVVVDETSPPAPENLYDRTKLEGERAALGRAAEGMDVVVVRPGWAYGPGDRRTFKLIREIARGRFMLVAGGRGRQTPVYADDLVRGLLAAAERGRRGEVYIIGGGEILTVREMSGAIARALGVEETRRNLPRLPAMSAALALEAVFTPLRKEAPLNRGKLAFFLDSKAMAIDKARRELGYAPEVAFETGMRRAVAWYRENGWLDA